MKYFLFALLLSCATAQAMDYTAVFNAPPKNVPTRGMPDGPLLGNGDVGVVLAGPAETQQFYIGKNDFWTHFQGDPKAHLQSKVINVGRIELSMPALQGASYRQEQDLAKAEVRGTFVKDALTVRTRSWVQATENLLMTELQCAGGPVKVSLRHVAGGSEDNVPASVQDNQKPVTVGREMFGGGRWKFEGEIADVVVTNVALSGAPPSRRSESVNSTAVAGGVVRELPVTKMSKMVSVAAWIKIARVAPDANYIVSKGTWNEAYSLGLSGGKLRWSINGTFVQTKLPLPTDKWLYVAGTFDGTQMCAYVDGALMARLGRTSGTAEGWFTRKADADSSNGREVAVVSRVIRAEGMEFELQPGKKVTVVTAILSDLDAKDPLPAARRSVASFGSEEVAESLRSHRQWWDKFWARSFIEIPDKVVEKHWYGALYVMGSCSREGKVAPGLWGNWLTTDYPNWQGDYHLNYNYQAPFYVVYGANHADLSLPVFPPVMDWMPQARDFAREQGWKGVHYAVSIGPWGWRSYNPRLDLGQRSNAAYVALNFIWYWQYTQDKEWLKATGYPFLRAVAEFWEDYLKFENGRYVIYNDSIHEGSGPDMNPILSLGLLRTLFKNMIPMSESLGADADRRAKWQDIRDKLSPFPTQQSGNGKTVFRYSEKGMAWCGSNTLGIQHIFPAGAIGLDSDPKLLKISHDTIEALNRWADYNGFSSWYTACARVGYDPKEILKRLRAECDKHAFPNLLLYYGGGGIESCGGFLALNEMLLQSHEGVLRFFPCWPKDQDAKFGKLRAVGAFLVSAELKNGEVTGVKIVSVQGRDCTVQNPWPGKAVKLAGSETLTGERFTFKTKPGETIQLQPE